ncbi:uncharacterized protein LOC123271424 [Cotesia glomerata]|uniref:uncharacterized protein LOC123271424 n=1 Tax=Cotesia glomerata TaxID=32391 RepID=UPI001D0227FF|nr:uncharacterized protein LOC123271424 [Cotesia glomerata]
MPLVPDTCAKCKRPVKTPVICNICQQHFHPGCARDYIKNRPITDCCRKQLNYLLQSLDSSTATVSKRLTSIKSVNSNISSISSFKSASSSPLVRSSTARASTSLKLPVTPNTPVTPGPDSVFYSPITSPVMFQLPTNWSEKSLDDKITALMEQFLSANMSVNKKLEELGTRIADLKVSQATTMNELSEVKSNVKINADSISKLNTDIEKLKEANEVDMNIMHTKLIDLSKSISSESKATSSTLPTLGCTTELVISGIPDSVANKMLPLEISSAVLNALDLPNLVSDILSTRKFENRNGPRQDKTRTRYHSFIVDLKSSRVRDFIISSKRKSKNLLAKTVFPTCVEQNSGGTIYINEFLLPETHKLLLQTKEKAKSQNFKYVWVTSGQIFVKRDDGSEKFKVNCVSDLTKLV